MGIGALLAEMKHSLNTIGNIITHDQLVEPAGEILFAVETTLQELGQVIQ